MIDRTGWPPGPWDDEPDEVEWQFDDPPGFVGIIRRNELGALCGYVGVPHDHPLFGFPFTGYGHLNVHGGVTFAAPFAIGHHIGWLIGFDCAHCFDDMPGMLAVLPPEYFERRARLSKMSAYRDLAYVRAQVESLARQLSAVDGPIALELEREREKGDD